MISKGRKAMLEGIGLLLLPVLVSVFFFPPADMGSAGGRKPDTGFFFLFFLKEKGNSFNAY